MAQLGLTTEEMLSTFNRMYLDVWSRYKQQIDWRQGDISRRLEAGEKVDLGDWLVEVMEVMATASRDSAILTMAENNERIAAQLNQAGIDWNNIVPGQDSVRVEDE